MSEHTDMVISILNSMRILPGPRYYTLEELTFRRHHMVLEIMGLINEEIQKYRIDTKDYDPLSFLLSTPYTSSESTDEGAQFNPILSIIKTLIHPKYEYFKYHDKEGVKYVFWKYIDEQEAVLRRCHGRNVPYSEDRKPLKLDTFFSMKPDDVSTSYMGAVVAHNSENIVNKKPHMVEVYYVRKYWTSKVQKKYANGTTAFQPMKNTELLKFEGGYTGDPVTQKVSYVEKSQTEIFGIDVQSILFQGLFDNWKKESGDRYWTYESYTNILITLLLMEHELHHALIGRYSPIMQDAPDLLVEEDLKIESIKKMVDMYKHYSQKGLPGEKEKAYRIQYPIESGNQYGAVDVPEHGWFNSLTNNLGHNAFFGHLTFRSGLFGLAVTVGHQKSTASWEHTILGLKPLNNSSDVYVDDGTDVDMEKNTAVVDFIEDIFNNKLKLKF
tara:strand:- start:24 stop:1346 length:1323 start_codon:yes stop_codon:yes gene_type:complete